MATAIQKESSHIDTLLPDPPSAAFFTETQWKNWYALMDTVIPSVVPTSTGNKGQLGISSNLIDSYYDAVQSKMSSPPTRAEFEAYFSEKPSEIKAFRIQMTRTLASVPTEMRDQIGSVLNLLG